MSEERMEELKEPDIIIVKSNPFWPVMVHNIVAMACSTVIALTFKNPWWVMAALPFIALANGYGLHDGD